MENLNLDCECEFGKQSLFFQFLCYCPCLKSLSLSLCPITPQSVIALTTVLTDKALSFLEELNLDNNVSVGSDASFFAALRNCPKLKSLDISDCSVNVKSIAALTEVFNSNTLSNLEHLDLSYSNQIGNVALFFAALSKCPKLKILCFNYCTINNQSLAALVNVFNSKRLQNLEELGLQSNETTKNIGGLVSSLQNCPALSILNITGVTLHKSSLYEINLLKQRNPNCHVIF